MVGYPTKTSYYGERSDYFGPADNNKPFTIKELWRAIKPQFIEHLKKEIAFYKNKIPPYIYIIKRYNDLTWDLLISFHYDQTFQSNKEYNKCPYTGWIHIRYWKICIVIQYFDCSNRYDLSKKYRAVPGMNMGQFYG